MKISFYPALMTLLALCALVSSTAARAQSTMNFFVTRRRSRQRRGPRWTGGALTNIARDSPLPPESAAKTGALISAPGRCGGWCTQSYRPGPWMNAKGVFNPKRIDDLHSANNNLTKQNALTEKGGVVNGRGYTPNTHDMLTGTGPDGRAIQGPADATCKNWTSSTGCAASSDTPTAPASTIATKRNPGIPHICRTGRARTAGGRGRVRSRQPQSAPVI
jgi:hypothetical protein